MTTYSFHEYIGIKIIRIGLSQHIEPPRPLRQCLRPHQLRGSGGQALQRLGEGATEGGRLHDF